GIAGAGRYQRDLARLVGHLVVDAAAQHRRAVQHDALGAAGDVVALRPARREAVLAHVEAAAALAAVDDEARDRGAAANLLDRVLVDGDLGPHALHGREAVGRVAVEGGVGAADTVGKAGQDQVALLQLEGVRVV